MTFILTTTELNFTFKYSIIFIITDIVIISIIIMVIVINPIIIILN